MFKLVRRDGARENSGHFEALGHGGVALKVGQVVYRDASGKAQLCTATTHKPYGIVARDEEASGAEVIVLRITDEMEFETTVTGDDTNIAKAIPGFKLAIGADKYETDAAAVTAAADTLGEDAYGAEVVESCAKTAGDKITVRFAN